MVLCGPNGSGKTNLLEALSLLASGQGLRGAPYQELAKVGEAGWAVAAHLRTAHGAVDIGTGGSASSETSRRSGRIVRIDGEDQAGSGALADYVEMVWLTPAMDGLFTGPASERRRFLDRLIACFDPGYRTRVGAVRACHAAAQPAARRRRARRRPVPWLRAHHGRDRRGIAASRAAAVAEVQAAIDQRRAVPAGSVFPWAELALSGMLETDLATRPALDVEDDYLRALAAGRERDRAAGRALEGPHRSDLVVGHGPKEMPARCAPPASRRPC